MTPSRPNPRRFFEDPRLRCRRGSQGLGQQSNLLLEPQLCLPSSRSFAEASFALACALRFNKLARSSRPSRALRSALADCFGRGVSLASPVIAVSSSCKCLYIIASFGDDGLGCLPETARLAGFDPLWQAREPTRRPFRKRFPNRVGVSRHSSVVEHVIGNDGVDCSIQSGGTTLPQDRDTSMG
jgi:hypothetical protein